MNKVTTINLNGHAYQFEESGYELLKKYLDQARRKLGDDPDKEEILADFERAIADKCDSHLRAHKNVITTDEAKKIIDDMGPVEPSDDSDKRTDDDSVHQPKRLYTLSDGAVIGGVCNGLAAYLNIDVTVVRLAFVLLVFVTGGSVILIYLLLMLIIPEARTPEEKAELRGERFSAQEVMGRAKKKYADISNKEHWRKVAEQNQPILSNLGDLLLRVIRALAIFISLILGLVFGVITVAWVSGLWWLAFGHPNLPDQLHTISMWTIAAGVTAGYFTLALPIGVLAMLFLRIGVERPIGKQGTRWIAAIASLWIVSIGVVVGVAAVTGGRLSDYQASHARIDFDNHQICINSGLCGGNNEIITMPPPPQALTAPTPPTITQVY